MGVPTLDVGYTSAKTGKGDHEVHKGQVVALVKKNFVEASDGFSKYAVVIHSFTVQP
jgi:hypothetical protein